MPEDAPKYDCRATKPCLLKASGALDPHLTMQRLGLLCALSLPAEW
jgi:hypothetical protein